MVKWYVREIESEEGVIIVDNSIAGKPCTDENDIIGWHTERKSDGLNRGDPYKPFLRNSEHS